MALYAQNGQHPFCRSLPILMALISMGCAVNGAPTWAKRLPIFHAGY
jgi:hypothetical protein